MGRTTAGRETMSSEEEHEERWSEVDEDVFEVEQNGEQGSAKVEVILRD